MRQVNKKDFQKGHKPKEDLISEIKIISLLEKGEVSADAISTETGIDPGKLLALMMQLEMMKKVVQLPGRRFSLRRTIKK